MHPGRARLVVALAALLAIGAGCAPAPPAPPPPPPPVFDPPLGFGPPSGRLFEGSGTRVSPQDADELPAALDGDTVWVTDGGGLQRVDAQGRVTPMALPPGRTAGGRPLLDPPALPSRVLVGSATVVPGSGTTPPGLAAELIGVDAATGAPGPSVSATLPWSARPAVVRLRVLGSVAATEPGGLPGSGATRAVTVLSAATDSQRTVVGVDLAAGRVLWSVDGVEAAAVAGGSVFGVETAPGRTASYTPSSVVALDGASGARRAVVADGLRTPTVVPAGPSLVAVTGRRATTSLFGTGASTLSFVDPAGRTVRTAAEGEHAGRGSSYTLPRCTWDEAAVTVCATDTTVEAFDAATAAPLWSLPDPGANRVAPRVTTAWHGAVYGTTVNGPVVLDARTGTDRDTAPGAAPVMVDGRLAIAVDTGGVAGFGGGASLHPAVR